MTDEDFSPVAGCVCALLLLLLLEALTHFCSH